MKEIRLNLTSIELKKVIEQVGEFNDIVLVQDSTGIITHRKTYEENDEDYPGLCTVQLEVYGIKSDNITAKYGFAKVCPCGTLFIVSDIQEVK